jgi:hypothetical protein
LNPRNPWCREADRGGVGVLHLLAHLVHGQGLCCSKNGRRIRKLGTCDMFSTKKISKQCSKYIPKKLQEGLIVVADSMRESGRGRERIFLSNLESTRMFLHKYYTKYVRARYGDSLGFF